MNKKILLITSTFLPEQNPRAFRWGSLSKALVKSGYEIDIFTQRHKDIVRESGIPGIRYYETDGYLFHKFIYRNVLQGAEGRVVVGEKRNYSKIKNVIKKILAYLARTFIWPDISGLWYLSSRRKIRELMRDNNYDCIISSCPGFASHLIAYYAKSKSKNVKWIGEYGDPYSFGAIQSKSVFSFINKPVEAMILKKMDYIVVPVDKSKKGFLEHFPTLDDKKIKVIPQSFENITPEPGNINWNYFNGDKINIVYVGTLYPNIRNPEMLLKSILLLKKDDVESYEKLRFHFFGKYENLENIFKKYQELLDDKTVVLYGGVFRENCSFACQKANFLLNISNTASYQTPSKLIEYLAYKKPIISLENKMGAEAEWPFLIRIDYDSAAVIKFLKNIFSYRVKFSADGYDDILKNYDINNIRSQYDGLISSLC